MDTALALDYGGGYPASDVIITSSVAAFSNSTINFTARRVYVALSDNHPALDGITLVFSKFEEPVRSNVIVIAKIGNALWHFYRFIEFGCTKKSAESVVNFAECDEMESENLKYLKTSTKFNGKKCPIIVAATTFEPFTYYDDSRGFYKGIEYSLVKTIARQLQIDVKFIPADVNSIKCVYRKLDLTMTRIILIATICKINFPEMQIF